MIDASRIVITRHAWKRFKERWGAAPIGNYSAEIRRMLAEAEPEDLGYGLIHRVIDNGFKGALYYTTGDWRFVVDETGERLLTCERPYWKQKRRRP